MTLKVVSRKGKKVLKGSLPIGELNWVFITGEGRDNYNEDGKIYQASIAWPEKIAKPIIKQVRDYYDSFGSDKDQQGGMGFSIGVLVDDGGDEPVEKFVAPAKVKKGMKKSGRIQMAFSTATEFDGKPNIIPVYDGTPKRVQLPEGVSIGNGSRGTLQVVIRWGESAKKQFISNYLQGVQVTKLVKYEGDVDFEAPDEDEDEEVEDWASEVVDNGGFEADTGTQDTTEDQEANDNFDDDIPF